MTSTISQQVANNTDANFRLWAQWIHDKLTAAGWVNTADTGQINLATVLTPTGGVFRGYEIWRMADALQSTNPVFMKIEYGDFSSGAQPCVRITLSTSTNGAGTPTGQTTTAMKAAMNGNETTARNSFFSGDTNRFVFALCADSTATAANACIFGVERTKNSDGTDSTEGAVLFCVSACSAVGSYGIGTTMMSAAGAIPVQNVGYLCDVQAGTTGVLGSDLYTYPVYPNGFYPRNPLMNCVGYFNGDLTRETPVTLDIYGANHTYLPCASPSGGFAAYIFSGGNYGGPSTGRVAIRYE